MNNEYNNKKRIWQELSGKIFSLTQITGKTEQWGARYSPFLSFLALFS